MECSFFYNGVASVGTISGFIAKICRKLNSAVYAGLIVYYVCVPSVCCISDWSRRAPLTYEQIYNSTSYAQLRPSYKLYNIPVVRLNFSNNRNSQYNNSLADTKVNEVEYAHRYNQNTRTRGVNSLRVNTHSQETTKKETQYGITLQPHSHDVSQRETQFDHRSHPQSHEVSIKETEYGHRLQPHSQDAKKKDLILVGFARDPFRLSIPEDDYLKGVREISPEQYMNRDNRGKRGVVHLYNMLTCATGCDPIAYKGYGCYCGFLGSGRPADGIDNCCKIHDECYEHIRCPFYTVYFQPYYWKCYHGQPLCALENYQTQHQFINGCAARLCECDRQFAMCVRKYSCPRGRPLCRSDPLRFLQNILAL